MCVPGTSAVIELAFTAAAGNIAKGHRSISSSDMLENMLLAECNITKTCWSNIKHARCFLLN